MKSYVYLHGFASSPASRKAQFFASKLDHRGIALQIPNLDGGDFEHLTISGQLEIVRNVASVGSMVLLGSSLGGYLAALYAERHGEVERLVLLAPAFDFRNRFAARLGPETLANWKALGKLPVYHYGLKQEALLAYELYDDAAQFAPYPDVHQPTLVIQGSRDDVVPPELAQRFCGEHPGAELHLLEDGHELANVLEETWAIAERFLFA